MMRKAVVLLSGGMDSATALYWARSEGYACSALLFDYGQKHKRELSFARAITRMAGVPHEVVRFHLPWGGSALTDRRIKIPHHRLDQIGRAGIPVTYVPARNTIFLSFALSWADATDCEAIIIGANALDFSGYPDCRPAYYRAMQRTAREGTKRGIQKGGGIRILTPLIRLRKADIIRLGSRLGVPYEKTWSCYGGKPKICGMCDACQLRAKGFEEVGFPDPLNSGDSIHNSIR